MKVSGTRCYTRYEIGTGYDFGTGDGYWWTIRRAAGGKYVVQMNGIVDKVCSSYLKACRHMDRIKAMLQEAQ